MPSTCIQYLVRVCISLYVLDLDYDSKMISIGRLKVVEITYDLG